MNTLSFMISLQKSSFWII